MSGGNPSARWAGYAVSNRSEMMSNAEFNEEQHQLELAAKDAEIERLRATLAAIAALDPAVDSKDGFNEWGEADCFNKAQAMAREALSARPNVPVKPPPSGGRP